MKRIPSIDTIESVCHVDRDVAIKVRRVLDGRDDPTIYPAVAQWVGQCFHPPRTVELKLAAVNELLDTYGTESLRSCDVWDNGYWLDTVAVYCNTGDTYNGTILYDVERDVFYATSYGNWVETVERTRRFEIN